MQKSDDRAAALRRRLMRSWRWWLPSVLPRGFCMLHGEYGPVINIRRAVFRKYGRCGSQQTCNPVFQLFIDAITFMGVRKDCAEWEEPLNGHAGWTKAGRRLQKLACSH